MKLIDLSKNYKEMTFQNKKGRLEKIFLESQLLLELAFL